MKCCKVHFPFRDKVTGELYKADTEILLSEERVAEVKAFDPNLISVLCDAVASEKPKRTRKKKTE